MATADPAVVLAGSLTLPPNRKPHAVVVFISGSGGHVRDQVISGTPMFGVMAHHLAEAGIAGLRVDDRGTGKSTGPKVQQSTTRDRARDMQACVAWLREQPVFKGVPLGLIGHSEGAMIAPMLAVEHPKPAFVILLSAPTRPGRDVFIQQQMAQTKAEGQHNAEELNAVSAALADVADTAVARRGKTAMNQAVVTLFKAWKAPPEAFEGNDVQQFADAMSTPWRTFFFEHDPAPVLSQLTQPVLAVYGAADRVTAFRDNGASLVAALGAAPTNRFDLKLLPDQDHFFLRAPGEPAGKHVYGKMVLAPELLSTLTHWIGERTQKQPS